MIRALEMLAIGVVCFILAQELVDNLITGTDIGSVVLQNITALAIAVGVSIAAILAVINIRGRGIKTG